MTIDELQSIRDILMRHEHVTAVTDEVYVSKPIAFI